jgi:hypothetical protein
MQKIGIKKIEDFQALGKADYHIHTNYSDGKPTPREVLDYVENHTDLDVIAISDHDTLEGALEARKLMKQKKYRFELIIGEEVTSREGHIVGLFLKKAVPAGLSAQETVREIKKQGGVVIAAHPFVKNDWNNAERPMMNGVGLKTLLNIGDQFDGIEIVNATPTLSDENLSASFFNKAFLFQAETGGSDAHILEGIGKGYTLFDSKSKRKSASDFRWAIRHHQTRAMYIRWTLLALMKYFFFFVPLGLRIVWNTILHGKKEHPEDEVFASEQQ